MKNRGLARRGLNLGAVRIAMVCDWAASVLIDFADPYASGRYVTRADALDELDIRIVAAEHAMAAAETAIEAGGRLSNEYRRAAITAQVLREFRYFLLGVDP